MAAHRIVLVNRSGDELFWGSSVLKLNLDGGGAPSNLEADIDIEEDEEDPPTVPPFDERDVASGEEEPCPATLRSSVFVRAQRDEPASSRERVIEVTLA